MNKIYQAQPEKKDRITIDISPNTKTELFNSDVIIISNTQSKPCSVISRKTLIDTVYLLLQGATTKRYEKTIGAFFSEISFDENIIKLKIQGKAHAYEVLDQKAEIPHYSYPLSLLHYFYTGETYTPTATLTTLDRVKGGFEIYQKDLLFSEKINNILLRAQNINSYLNLNYNERENAGIKNLEISPFSRMTITERIAFGKIGPQTITKEGNLSFSVKSTALNSKIIIEDYFLNFRYQKYGNMKR